MARLCRFNFDNFVYNFESNVVANGFSLPTTIGGAIAEPLSMLTAIDSALNFGARIPKIPGGKAAVYGYALYGAYYAGVLLGSAIMASNRATRCDLRQLRRAAKDLSLYGSWIDDAVNHFPDIMRAQ
ncbi:hypothetical protein BSQ33_21505 (plasmid) [Vibrio gazogenes]|uniref:Uncharacterized protein n=1 Tax=Vibrio gazogenes TaxID=687 RepID=A0A1Z2SMK6_VIBGA|nr:hypothetical protein BSQ33_00850 [Vibrio gazogenes]ASA58359.1 hypothetical protein BSQ33_21505 [Vibrio gazogenes]